MQNSTHIDH